MGQNQDVISDLNVGTEHNGAMKNQPPTTGAIASEEAEDKDHKPASAGVGKRKEKRKEKEKEKGKRKEKGKCPKMKKGQKRGGNVVEVGKIFRGGRGGTKMKKVRKNMGDWGKENNPGGDV